MISVAATDALLTGPVSPELVLVSPPEVARLARNILSSPPAARPAAATHEKNPGRVELSAVWLFCVAMTLGPLLFTALATR